MNSHLVPNKCSRNHSYVENLKIVSDIRSFKYFFGSILEETVILLEKHTFEFVFIIDRFFVEGKFRGAYNDEDLSVSDEEFRKTIFFYDSCFQPFSYNRSMKN